MIWIAHEHLRSGRKSRPWLILYAIEEAAELVIATGARSWSQAVASRLRAWHERSRQRWALQMLDDRLLRDVGLTRADVEPEVRKWFWMR